jgi:hypothetical protein
MTEVEIPRGLPKPGAIALRAAGDAEANVGIHEAGGENHGKWVEVYLRSVGLGPGAPWCAAFVHYRLVEAARELGSRLPADFPSSGYCPDYEAWAKRHGVWLPNSFQPLRGDLCLFYFPAKQRVAHMGIVVKPLRTGFRTVEGNTGPDRAVNTEGDGVYRKLRRAGSLGKQGGFVRLGF